MALLLETSLATLLQNVNKYFETEREENAQGVKVVNLTTSCSIEANSITFNATTKTQTNQYETTIQFEDVGLKTSREYNTEVEIVDKTGTTYFLEPIEMGYLDCKVSCKCMDFYMRFAGINQRDGSLYGIPPTPYTPKGNTNRPPANPAKKPGICKHIIAMALDLEREGKIVRNEKVR